MFISLKRLQELTLLVFSLNQRYFFEILTIQESSFVLF